MHQLRHSRLPITPHIANASTALSPNARCHSLGRSQMKAYKKCGLASMAATAQGLIGHRGSSDLQ